MHIKESDHWHLTESRGTVLFKYWLVKIEPNLYSNLKVIGNRITAWGAHEWVLVHKEGECWTQVSQLLYIIRQTQYMKYMLTFNWHLPPDSSTLFLLRKALHSKLNMTCFTLTRRFKCFQMFSSASRQWCTAFPETAALNVGSCLNSVNMCVKWLRTSSSPWDQCCLTYYVISRVCIYKVKAYNRISALILQHFSNMLQ